MTKYTDDEVTEAILNFEEAVFDRRDDSDDICNVIKWAAEQYLITSQTKGEGEND